MNNETLEIIARSLDPSRLMTVVLESVNYNPGIVEQVDTVLDGRLAKFIAGGRCLTKEQADAIAPIFPEIPKRLWLGNDPK